MTYHCDDLSHCAIDVMESSASLLANGNAFLFTVLLKRVDGLLNSCFICGLVFVAVIPVVVLEAKPLALWSIYNKVIAIIRVCGSVI